MKLGPFVSGHARRSRTDALTRSKVPFSNWGERRLWKVQQKHKVETEIDSFELRDEKQEKASG